MARPCPNLLRCCSYGTSRPRYFAASSGSKPGARRTGDECIRKGFAFVASLKDCAEKKDLSRGVRLHADVVELGLLDASPHLASALITMYAKCGVLAKARDVVHDTPLRNVTSWNALLSGYAQQGRFHDALNCFEQMQREGIAPNAITFICILKACGCIGAIEKGKQIHQEIVVRSLLVNDVVIGTALVDMYAKCGALTMAQQLLEELPVRNVVSWNALIAGYVHHEQYYEALNCFDQMQSEGVLADVITFTCIIKACGSTGSMEKGKQIHDEIVNRGLLEKDTMLGNALLDMYARCGVLSEAQQVLEELPVRDVVSWNSMIVRHAQQGQGHEALNCYEQMQKEGLDPDAATFIGILKACGNGRYLEKGKKIHEHLVSLGLLKKDIMLTNALVDMFAKCGVCIKDVQDIQQLPPCDEHSWNALIAWYTREGQGSKALHYFEQMQKEGFSPDILTFICALKACANVGALTKGRKLHREISMKGFLEGNIVLGACLVDMYVQCGTLALAEQVVEELALQDSVSWSTLIAGYAKQGKDRQVLNCFVRMQSKGLHPDAVTFISILKACGNTKAIERGRKVHDDIVSRCLLENDVVLGTALVNMYAKCGDLSKAQQVLEELQIRDVVAWNALISGYAQQGLGDEALDCFDRMQSEGLSPHAVTFACILKACASTGAIEKGRKIHEEIKGKGLLEKDVVLGTALVDMYAKCGMIAKAQEVIEELAVRNVVTWNALITGYTQQGQCQEALNCFEQMLIEGLSPNTVTFICVLKACGSTGSLGKGKQIHETIVNRGFLQKYIVLGNGLVDMYAKCGVLSKAQQVLKELHVRNVVSWNALINGYAEHGQGHEAVNSFDQMQSEGLAPDDVTYMCVLKACGGIGAVEKGKQIHNEIINRRFLETDIEKDIVLGTALVDMYAKCGELVKAQKLHEELRIRNVISWSALIAGYVQQGQCHEALNCFERMQSEGLPPNEVTFICILKACGNTGAVNKGKQIHNEILCGGFFSKDVAIGNVLVDMYAKCGVLRQAQKVLEELPVRSVVSWNALISGYAQEGQGHEALNCFWRMQSEGFRPDEITCLCVLSACSHSGLTDDAQMLFGSMTRRYGIVPNLEHHTCMVAIFGFSGRFDMAMQVIRAMPSSDYPAVWLALLGGCRKWGNVKLGILAFDQAVQLDDACAVIYVLMAEIFAAAGMQKDAEKIEAMRLKATNCKDPGSNLWIDAGGNVSLCFPRGVTGALCK